MASGLLSLPRLLLLPRRFPISFGVSVSAAKTVAADAFAQTRLEGRSLHELDLRRTGIFFVWGSCYLGGVQYFIYNILFPRFLFPSVGSFIAKPLAQRLADRNGMLTVAKQVWLDQVVHHPLVLFPAFYCVKETIESGGTLQPGSAVVRDALQKYRANFVDDLKVCWGVWIPSFFFNFTICPLWMRVPFVAVVSFGFTSYFSFMRGSPQQLVEDKGTHTETSSR